MRVLAVLMFLASSLLAVDQRDNRPRINRQPIIDVHKHASWPGADDASARKALLAEMDDENIVLSLLHINEPGDVVGWLQAAPGRFIGGPAMPCSATPNEPFFRCFPETKGWPDLTWLEREMAAGHIGILGEMLFNYTGVHPDDKRMAPYWQDGHAAVHKTIFRNSTQREHLEELKFVGPDAAVVRFCSVLTGSDQSPTIPIRSRKFLVVTKREGAWKISWGQNTRLREDVADSECFATLRKRTG